ncbi:alpha/beta hydrolase [Dyella nitratireducens]|uniref:Hydrolase n=1 Tax=Dyella nitratireducens TaxID=1849580 RepID=A0ABQ1FTH0_9GAMM|nr:alpha/beta hydrolase [Dyella nitratireducens]GGA27186.1 hydrolase [Dyella nitratireducens]GLQ43449.1 hydrolase [Dyella nitratireducens]
MERQAGAERMASSEKREDGALWLTMADGQRLFLRDWPGQRAHDAVLIVHGLGEHSGRYEALAQWFLAHGYAVRSYDQRGHGRSPGQRGALRRSDDLLSDLATVYEHYATSLGTPPLLLGHSMGGLVAVRAVLDGRVEPPRLVLSSPALRSYEAPWLHRLAAVLTRTLPNLPLRNGLPLDGLSHDTNVLDAYRNDPLCMRSVTPRLADFIFRAGASSIADGWRLRVPTLLLAAGSDRLVDPSGSREFSNNAWATKHLTSRFFDTLFHELFNETETGRRQVLAQLLDWLRRTRV